MEKYIRPSAIALRKKLAQPVRKLLMLAGPRQVGKTTAVRQILSICDPASFEFIAVDAPVEDEPHKLDFSLGNANALFAPSSAVLPSQRDERWLIQTWQSARTKATEWQQQQIQSALQKGDKEAPTLLPYVLVLDEIQNIPRWSNAAKGLWDQDRAKDFPMHVVVLGSAPLLMRRDVEESLAGRFDRIDMTHWSYTEMRDCFGFTLNQYLYFGGYPGPAQHVLDGKELEWKKEVLRSLIEPNLGKDILALARIEKPALLRQLFELGCAYSGQIVSMTKLLVQLKDAGNTTTLTHYLLLLKATGLLCGLEKFSQHKIRQRAAPPKLQVLNTAFLTVYCGLTYEEAQRDTRFWGHLVESAVGAHLLNTADLDLTVGYWRESPFEVDFVITQGQRIAALEVKSSKPKSGAGRGLEKFSQQNLHLAVRTHLVGGNDEALALALETSAADWLRT